MTTTHGPPWGNRPLNEIDRPCACSKATWCVSAHGAEAIAVKLQRRRRPQRVELRLVGGVWHGVHFYDDKPDPYIMCLFGTNAVPLPFTNDASEEMMRSYARELRAVFNDHDIILRLPEQRRDAD